jgi:hypothetical protein
VTTTLNTALRPTTQRLYDEWMANPARLVLLVDETRSPVLHEREFVAFYCVPLLARDACEVLRLVDDARVLLDEPDTSFKCKDLLHHSALNRYGELAALVCGRIRATQNSFVAMTTQRRLDELEKANLRARFAFADAEPDRPAVLKGRELLVPSLIVREIAVRLALGDVQVDVVVDRSQQLGLDGGTRLLQPGTFEVLGPGRLDRGPGGKPLEPSCETSFRWIAAGDNVAGFRDLLLLPEMLGYLDSKQAPNRRDTVVAQVESVWF